MTRHHPTEPLTVVGAGGLSGSAAHPVTVRRRHRPTETPSLPHPGRDARPDEGQRGDGGGRHPGRL